MKSKKKPRRAIGRRVRSTKPKSTKAKTHEAFLRRLDPDKRAALEKLRKSIRAAVPEAEECISYGIPSYRLNGKFLVSYGAGANHCAFYPGSVVQALADDLSDYDLSKGTIRFSPHRPLPDSLVRKLMRARLQQR